jgi:hypothetical protein
MRHVINTTANVTTTAICHRNVRTVVAGVDALRALPVMRLYAAPAPQAASSFAGKQKPALGLLSGDGGPLGRCLDREPTARWSSRCRRPRIASCLERCA